MIGWFAWVALAFGGEPLSADAVVRAAIERYPAVAAADGAVLVERGELADGRGFGVNPEFQVGEAVVGGLTQGGFFQPVSISGEASKRRDAARAGIDAAVAAAGRTRLEIAAAARHIYADAVAARSQSRLAETALEQAVRMRASIERRAGSGEASSLDVHLARLTQADAVAVAVAASQRSVAAELALAELFAPDVVIELPVDPRAALPGAGTPVGERSDVRAAEARLRRAEANLRAERAAVVPPIGVGVFFQVDVAHGDPGDIGPQIAWTPPLWNRNRRGVAEASVEVRRAYAELDVVRARAAREADLHDGLAAQATGWVDALGDVDATGRAGLSAIDAAFASGELSVTAAVAARREVLTGWSGAIEARALAVEARIAAMLAAEDANLLPVESGMETR